MEALPTPDQLNAALQKCLGLLAEEMPKVADPEVRANMQAIAGELQKNQAILQVEYPKALAHIQETSAAAQQSAQQTLAEMEKLQAQIDAMDAEQKAPKLEAPPAPPAMPEVDPALGGQWRAELLAWLAGRNPVKRAEQNLDNDGSIATYWKESEGAEESEGASQPKPATPAANPPAGRPALRPKTLRPLSRPPEAPKPESPKPPAHDESIGKMSFDDE